MIVAIDGPAGSGKSTVAVALADRLGFRYLDTGAMYRALTWLALREGISLDAGAPLAELSAGHPVSFGDDRTVMIAGEDVTDEIREPEIDRFVPVVAAHPEVRAVMRERQRALGEAGDAVIEGRDIGTVVAPRAEVKIFLVADAVERARRRTADRTGIASDELAAELRRRDARDAANTQPAPDAVVLDTTHLTVEDVLARIEELVDEARR